MKALIVNEKLEGYGQAIDLYPTQIKWMYSDNLGRTYELTDFIDVREIEHEKNKTINMINQLVMAYKAMEMYIVNETLGQTLKEASLNENVENSVTTFADRDSTGHD